MLKKSGKFIYISSGISPVFLVYAVSLAFECKFEIAAFCSIAFLFFFCLLIYLLWHCHKHLERFDFKIKDIETVDRDQTNFLLLYLSPLFTAQFNTINWGIIFPTLLVFSLVTIVSAGFYANPLMNLLGWRFYKISTDEGVSYILITKRELRNAKDNLKICQLTEYLVLNFE